MKPNNIFYKAINNRPYRSGAIFLTGAALAAAVTLLVVWPTRVAGECVCSKESAELVYEVTYDKTKDEVKSGWVWMKQAPYDRKKS